MIALILGIALVGFIVYLILTYIPMHQAFKTLIVVVVVVAVIYYLIGALGISDIPIPHYRR